MSSHDVDYVIKTDPTLNEINKKGKAGQHFALAVAVARQACLEAGLDGQVDDSGRPHFTHEQTAIAARHAREDAAAALTLQLAIMARLDRNRNYMWVIIALLLYIAFQFK